MSQHEKSSESNPGVCYTCRLKTPRLETCLAKDGSWAWICYYCWIAYEGDITEPDDYVYRAA